MNLKYLMTDQLENSTQDPKRVVIVGKVLYRLGY